MLFLEALKYDMMNVRLLYSAKFTLTKKREDAPDSERHSQFFNINANISKAQHSALLDKPKQKIVSVYIGVL